MFARKYARLCLQLACIRNVPLCHDRVPHWLNRTTMSNRPANDATPETGTGSVDGAAAESAVEELEVATSGGTRAMYWTHWLLLAVCSTVMVLAFVMQREGETVVYFPFTQTPMPETCHLKRDFGVDCPGCGLTRAFLAIAKFDFAKAFHFNPAGFFIFLMVAVQIPWRATQLVRMSVGKPQLSADWFLWYILLCAVVLVLQWFLRLGGISF